MASGSGDGKAPDLPRGLIDRRGSPAGKGRLNSLRVPRDLTLGGVPKRMFVPNIPVRRERSAPAENREQTDPKPRETSRERSERGRGRGRGRDGRGRGRGKGRGESNIVQTESVFEQGPSVQRVRAPESGHFSGRGWGGGGGGRSSRSGGSSGRAGGGGGGGESMSAFKFDDPDGSDTKDDFLKFVLGTEYAAPDLEDEEMAPSALPGPRSVSVKSEAEREPGRRNNYQYPIKQEPEAVEDEEIPSVSDRQRQTEMPSTSDTQRQTEIPSTSDRHGETEMPGISVRQRQTDTDQLSSDFVRLNMQPAELLMEASRSQTEILALVQLPDTLPGNPIPLSLCETKPPSAAKSSKDKPQEEQEEVTTPHPTLRNFKEGWLGKMRVRQSGKVELVLGNHVLDVTAGVPVDCLQELVSIRTDVEEPRMTYLGQVTQKMVITPNFESILQAVASEKS